MSMASRKMVKSLSFLGKPRASRLHDSPPFSLRHTAGAPSGQERGAHGARRDRELLCAPTVRAQMAQDVERDRRRGTHGVVDVLAREGFDALDAVLDPGRAVQSPGAW